MSGDPPPGAPGAVERSAGTTSSGQLLREMRRRAAALAHDIWGRGPERCEAHFAGPDLLVIVFHGGLTAAEASMKQARELQEVARSRDNFRHAVEPRLEELAERLTGRTVRTAIGSSRLDPDLTIEVLVLQPAGTRGASAPFADRLFAAEEDSRAIGAESAAEADASSAVRAQASQARRQAQDIRRETQETRRRRVRPDADRD